MSNSVLKYLAALAFHDPPDAVELVRIGRGFAQAQHHGGDDALGRRACRGGRKCSQ